MASASLVFPEVPSGWGNATIRHDMTLNMLINKIINVEHYRQNIYYIFQLFLAKVLPEFNEIKPKFIVEFLEDKSKDTAIREQLEAIDTILRIERLAANSNLKRGKIIGKEAATTFIAKAYNDTIAPFLQLLWIYISRAKYGLRGSRQQMEEYYGYLMFKAMQQYNSEMDKLSKGGRRTRRHKRKGLKSRRRNRK